MTVGAQYPAPTYESVRAALAAIPPNAGGHDFRVRIAFAVFDAIGDAGADLWASWAAARSRPDPAEDRATWKSCRRRGDVTARTLFGVAKQYGLKFDGAALGPPPSAAELRAQAAARREAEERERSATVERQRAAAIEAARLWASAQEVDEAEGVPYLRRKGAAAFGVRRLRDGTLLVPMRDAAGELVNVQRIAPERPADGRPEKLFVKGGRKTGGFHLLGHAEGAAWLLLCEGYATAASVHAATGRPVAVAFDCGNLLPVARALRGRWPGARLLIAGDDDRATPGNPGRTKAEAAARAVGGVAVFPPGELLPEGGSDFNDLHQAAGLAAVRDAIESAIAAAPAAEASTKAEERASRQAGSSRSQNRSSGRRRGRSGDSDDNDDDSFSRAGDPGSDGFACDDSGVWRHVPPGRNGDGGGWRRVCEPLHVEALARDQGDGAASLVLEFVSIFGCARRLILPLAALAGDGGGWRGMLADAGFPVPPEQHRRRWLAEYLASRRPERMARLTERTGWHGRAFVLPEETIGGDDQEPVLFAGERIAEGGVSVRGDLDKWRWLIGRHCVGQSRLMFAVAAALAGPCLAWAAGIDSGGVHFVGDSSTGKTTALRVAGSVYGSPAFLQRWRATDNGLEVIAAAHSDLSLCLDELAQLDPRTAGESAYLLGNATGKVRAGRSGGARPRLTWRLLFLSAGEVGLADHMREAGKRSRAGQELRLIDVPADAGCGAGVFDSRGEFDDAGALARHLGDACARAYGSLGRAWLEYLTEHTEDLSRELRERMAAFELQAIPDTASGQVARVGRRFALVAAAGELATAAGLTGWDEGQAQAATLRVFNAWIESRPAGIGAAEETAMLRQVRDWFEAHAEARLTDWNRSEDDHRPLTMHRAGWRRPVETHQGMVETESVEWLVLPGVFRNEVARGWRDRAVLRLLAQRGHLIREKGGEFASRVRVPGQGRVQVYRIRSSLFDEVES